MFNTSDFKTKTLFWERANCTDDKSWIIAADIGYSGVKIMSPSHCICFPSYAVRLSEDRGTLDVGSEYILYTDLESGEKWLVGQYAQDSISDRDTSVTEEALFGRERYGDPMFRVIIRTALGLGLLPGKGVSPEGRALSIQTGYPPAYESDSEELINTITGNHSFSLRIGNTLERTFRIFIDRKQVFLMAQPMGSLFSVSVDNEGRPLPDMRDLFRKSVLVFDAGFGTLDLFPIRNGRLEKSQTNQTLGMKRVMQETCHKLQEMQVQVTVPALQKYLDSGYARYHTRTASKNVRFDNILEESSKRICAEAVEWMAQMFPLYEFDCLIITGGTSAAWAPLIREHLKDMETLRIIDGNASGSLPFVFANVRGYYLYRVTKSRGHGRGDKA